MFIKKVIFSVYTPIEGKVLSKILTLYHSYEHNISSGEKFILEESEEAIVVLCTVGDRDLVAFGYALPALEIHSLVSSSDPNFTPLDNQIYLRLVFVDPAFRRKKIGTFIRQMLVDTAKELGFLYGACHVRRVFNWHDIAKKIYKPTEVRVVKNFWPYLCDPDANFMKFDL